MLEFQIYKILSNLLYKILLSFSDISGLRVREIPAKYKGQGSSSYWNAINTLSEIIENSH